MMHREIPPGLDAIARATVNQQIGAASSEVGLVRARDVTPKETLIYSPPPLPSTETRTDNASSNG
jgi:hypothetical protein